MMEERVINARCFQFSHDFVKYAENLGMQITPSTIPILNVKGLKVYFIIIWNIVKHWEIPSTYIHAVSCERAELASIHTRFIY